MRIEKEFLSQGQKMVPGIYGGMGPLAHIQFEQTLIAESSRRGATKDQEHPVYIVVSGASTPDRTKSLQGGEDSRSHLIRFAEQLERAGADFMVMTCNTAHAYIDDVRQEVTIPILSIIDTTADKIKEHSNKDTKVGVMATTGTIFSRLYDTALRVRKIESFAPETDSEIQLQVMDAIYNLEYGIKATGARVDSKAKAQLMEALDWYQGHGANAAILGCTELSVAFNQSDSKAIQFFDPLKILAERTLDLAFEKKE